jgi:hypothetical protein
MLVPLELSMYSSWERGTFPVAGIDSSLIACGVAPDLCMRLIRMGELKRTSWPKIGSESPLTPSLRSAGDDGWLWPLDPEGVHSECLCMPFWFWSWERVPGCEMGLSLLVECCVAWSRRKRLHRFNMLSSTSLKGGSTRLREGWDGYPVRHVECCVICICIGAPLVVSP